MSARGALTVLGSFALCAGLNAQPQIGGPLSDDRAAATTEAAVQAVAPHRPSALIPMYVSFATLQGLDVHSTLRAPEFGGREGNPIVGSMLDSPAALVAVKAGMTTGIVLVSERLWKRDKTAAVLAMIALNSTYAAIVAHNYAVEARASRQPNR